MLSFYIKFRTDKHEQMDIGKTICSDLSMKEHKKCKSTQICLQRQDGAILQDEQIGKIN